MNNDPKNLEQLLQESGQKFILIDDHLMDSKIMMAGSPAHSVDFDGKPKKGTRKPKNAGFNFDEKDEEDEYESHNMGVGDKEKKVLSYLSNLEDEKFDSIYQEQNDEESSEEIKVLFDVGFAFVRRALTNRRKKKKRSSKEAQLSDIETKVAPCWDGYIQRGMKKGRKGNMVPNCVPEGQQKSLDTWFKEDWVDISRPKKGGGYMPCGRADAKSGKYPKCVPASKAAKMSASEIASAVRRKRKAESTQTRVDKKPINVATAKKDLSAMDFEQKGATPTNPELYARVKAQAKKKFDVYPSAYANAWLVREYKKRGGGYRANKKSIDSDDIDTKSVKKKLRNPKGGLTAAGRAHFKRTEGANLKPGVKGAANTPEKMRRKGSFLTRFFTNPSGPMRDDKGRPTRLALSAAAWGEPVPQDREAAARLAEKGRNLLERYQNSKKKK